MITVNLGQIGVFRTDVSDAADAAALAGASVLSGTLLGLGLKSDMMCGESTVCLVSATILSCWSFWKGIAVLISSFVSQLCAAFEAIEDAAMGWTNAKKTAVQYAFNNAGIDEPRPTFESFLKSPYTYGITDIKSLGTNDLKIYYAEFLKGESDKSRKYGRQGFSNFIEDDEDGYWKEDTFGKAAPGEMSEVIINSGYGWEQIPGQEMFYNSYNNPKTGITGYEHYRNYVEVTCMAAPIYALDIYGIEDNGVFNTLAIILSVIIGVQTFRQIGGWWGAIIGALVAIIVYALMHIYPMGLKMINEDKQYEGNPVRITVKRHKGEEDLGLWEFHYGTIEAKAKAHVYREDDQRTIEPCFGDVLKDAFGSLSGIDMLNPLEPLKAIIKLFDGDSWNDNFARSRHLFEVKLIAAN